MGELFLSLMTIFLVHLDRVQMRLPRGKVVDLYRGGLLDGWVFLLDLIDISFEQAYG
jgi:hypothetical protein